MANKKQKNKVGFYSLFNAVIFTACSTSNSNTASTTGTSQTTSSVFMVKPVNFGYNDETATNNAFQQKTGDENAVKEQARAESEAYIQLLENNGVDVVAVEDTENPVTPDSVFPNNWFSTHEDGTLVLYPMYAEDRRNERKDVFLDEIKENFDIKRTVDLTHYEQEGEFLEGTGSMVLDRTSKIVYACKSPRTSEIVLKDFCEQLGYTYVLFDAVDKDNQPIYHTNVMMCVGTDYSVVCTDAIKDEHQLDTITKSLEKSGKPIVKISFDQMDNFAGNMLEIKNTDDERFLVMSQTAYNSLTNDQIATLSSHCNILTPNISCIEKNGGGSARCMLAELF